MFDIIIISRNTHPLFLKSISFSSRCFLGCSLNDDYLLNVFKALQHYKDRVSIQNHPHAIHWFALVDHEQSLQQDAKTDWEDYGIRLVKYDKRNDKHDALKSILEFWAGIAPAERRSLLESPVSYDRKTEVSR